MAKQKKTGRVGAARFERDGGGWWIATVAGLAAQTQGRTLEQATERLKEAVAALLDIETDAVVFETTSVVLPRLVDNALKRALEATMALRKQENEAEKATTLAAMKLTEEGLSLRDAGQLLGLSRQRIHQIVDAAKEG